MNLHIIGPVVITLNSARSMLYFESCNVVLFENILLKSNNCDRVIALQFTYIKMMEYSNITLFKNTAS